MKIKWYSVACFLALLSFVSCQRVSELTLSEVNDDMNSIMEDTKSSYSEYNVMYELTNILIFQYGRDDNIIISISNFFYDLGFDNLEFSCFIYDVNQHFNILLNPFDYYNNPTVGDLVSNIQSLIAPESFSAASTISIPDTNASLQFTCSINITWKDESKTILRSQSSQQVLMVSSEIQTTNLPSEISRVEYAVSNVGFHLGPGNTILWTFDLIANCDLRTSSSKYYVYSVQISKDAGEPNAIVHSSCILSEYGPGAYNSASSSYPSHSPLTFNERFFNLLQERYGDVNMSTRFDDIGDSLDFYECIYEMERTFGFQIDDVSAYLIMYGTIYDLYTYIQQMLA